MAVVAESEYGWVLDHETSINSAYTTVHGQIPSCVIVDKNANSSQFKCLPQLFEIWEPFRYDSQCQKLQKRGMATSESDGTSQHKEGVTDQTTGNSRKRKRKRKTELNPGETAAIEYHEKVREILKTALDQLLTLSRKKGCLIPAGPGGCHGHQVMDNNLVARKVAQQTMEEGDSLEELCELACQVGADSSQSYVLSEDDKVVPPSEYSHSTVVNTLVEHRSETASVRELLGSHYLLPPCCTFLMSDIKCLQPLLQGKKYDAVVLDPPWQNKSVKRKKKYNMLPDWDLLQLPVSQVTKPGSLVVVWVTNRQQQHNFVRDTLFPAWNVCYLTQWFWLKVTKTGTLVYDLDSTWKKPYEVLILGRVKRASNTEKGCRHQKPLSQLAEPTTTTDSPHSPHGVQPILGSPSSPMNSPETDQLQRSSVDPPKPVPDYQVIVSVPCSIHSRKPPLDEILKPYLPKSSECLELFARNLLPGWTSWGNQVLMFQHQKFFKEVLS